jgi:YD repeat-containing protein
MLWACGSAGTGGTPVPIADAGTGGTNGTDGTVPPSAPGQPVGHGTVTPAGGVVTVDEPASAYFGAEITFDPGAFDGDVEVEVVEVESLPAFGQLPVPVLRVQADKPLPAAAMHITVPSLDPQYGIPAEQQALFAVGLGAPTWVDVTEGAQKDGGGSLVGNLTGLVEAYPVELFGLNGSGIAEAVRNGSHEVADGETVGVGCAKCAVGVLLGDGGRSVASLVQPHQLVAPDGMSLYTWLCEAEKPALMVHGILSHFDAFQGDDDVIKGLTRKGFAVGKYAYPSGAAIDDNGLVLAAWLAEARSVCPSPGPALAAVGHSMGGLVLRSAIQKYGAARLVRPVVMLATPNGGNSSALLAALGPVVGFLALPGPSDLTAGGSTLDPAALEGINAPSLVAPHGDNYFVVTGWSTGEGAEAGDGYVTLNSALSLALPEGHEWYLRANENGRVSATEPPAAGDPWSGGAGVGLDHSEIHLQAATNGALSCIGQLLSGGTCRDGKWPGPCTVDYGSSRTTYTYDANGNVLSEEGDHNADGTVDSRTTYTYDANGNLLSEEWDGNADGTVHRRVTYTYDADGNLLTYESDSGADGTVDERYTYTYDANGNLLTEEHDYGADGTVDQRRRYTYDADGNQLTYESDYGADGTYAFDDPRQDQT